MFKSSRTLTLSKIINLKTIIFQIKSIIILKHNIFMCYSFHAQVGVHVSLTSFQVFLQLVPQFKLPVE